MKAAMTIIALGIATIAAPASAKTSTIGSGQTSAAAASNSSATSQATKYCISYEKTVGSRLDRQECKTKQQWARDGVEVDKLLAK